VVAVHAGGVDEVVAVAVVAALEVVAAALEKCEGDHWRQGISTPVQRMKQC
jgi:hypothetical protein